MSYLGERIAYHWFKGVTKAKQTPDKFESIRRDTERKLEIALRGKNVGLLTAHELARNFYKAMALDYPAEVREQAALWPLDNPYQTPNAVASARRLLECCEAALQDTRRRALEAGAPLVFYHLTLPFITHPDSSLMVWDDPHKWEGPNGWTEHGNAKTILVIASDEGQARKLAAERDCGIWLEPKYATCTKLEANQPGVISEERGGAHNE